MKIVRIVAFLVTFLCLVLGAFSLITPVEMSFDTGATSHSWSCGSAAFPNQLIDFDADKVEDAINCAGGTPASLALAAFLVAGAGLVAIVFLTWRIERAPRPETAVAAPSG